MTNGREEFAAYTNVSRETLQRFDLYADLIKKWNRVINLVAPSTLDDLWTRHFLDSAALFKTVDVPDGKWVDLGSGGGFPGAVVAILASEKSTSLAVTCIESDVRKAAFLRTLSIETGVSFNVLSRRVEDTPAQNVDIVSARALAPLPKLLDYAIPHLKPGGKAVFLKGEHWQAEVEEALASHRFSVKNIPSPTNPKSAILVLGDISRA